MPWPPAGAVVGVGPFVGPDALAGDGAGGVTDVGRDHPGAGDDDDLVHPQRDGVPLQ